MNKLKKTYQWLESEVEKYELLASEADTRKDVNSALSYRDRIIALLEAQIFILELMRQP